MCSALKSPIKNPLHYAATHWNAAVRRHSIMFAAMSVLSPRDMFSYNYMQNIVFEEATKVTLKSVQVFKVSLPREKN